MTYSIEQVEKGVVNFLDQELSRQYKQNSLQKVLIGAGVAILIRKKKDEIINVFKTIGIIDQNNGVDIELLKEELKNKIPAAGACYESNILGNITFTTQDIDKICALIEKGDEY